LHQRLLGLADVFLTPPQGGRTLGHLGFQFLAEAALALAHLLFGEHPLRGFDDDRDDAGGAAALVQYRRIVEVHPDRLGPPVPDQGQLLVLVRQRAAGKAHAHHVVVEVGDLGPALAHFRTEQCGMTAPGEDRVRIVVNHDALLAPQQHDGHGRQQEHARDGAQALRPALERTEAGRGPVEGAN
jgi:hypothetical protein